MGKKHHIFYFERSKEPVGLIKKWLLPFTFGTMLLFSSPLALAEDTANTQAELNVTPGTLSVQVQASVNFGIHSKEKMLQNDGLFTPNGFELNEINSVDPVGYGVKVTDNRYSSQTWRTSVNIKRGASGQGLIHEKNIDKTLSDPTYDHSASIPSQCIHYQRGPITIKSNDGSTIASQATTYMGVVAEVGLVNGNSVTDIIPNKYGPCNGGPGTLFGSGYVVAQPSTTLGKANYAVWNAHIGFYINERTPTGKYSGSITHTVL